MKINKQNMSWFVNECYIKNMIIGHLSNIRAEMDKKIPQNAIIFIVDKSRAIAFDRRLADETVEIEATVINSIFTYMKK